MFIDAKLKSELGLGADFGRCELDGVQYSGPRENENISTVYSDRMFGWDANKFNECCERVFGNTGQYFFERKKEDIDRFLSLYFGKEVKTFLIASVENRSNGYPTWRFDFCEME